MKKIIRLTESDLHRIVKKSVNRVLNEADYNMNSPEYKEMYDNGVETDWDREDRAQTDKEIEDYEALPEKARHPYGADIPDFSSRRDSQKSRSFANYNYGDKLSVKKPNNVLDKLLKKRRTTGRNERVYSHKGFLKNIMGFSDADATEMAENGDLIDTYNAYLRNATGHLFGS